MTGQRRLSNKAFGKSEYFEKYIENTSVIVLYGPNTY